MTRRPVDVRAKALGSAASAGLALALAMPAHAQGGAEENLGLEEIVVTAQHREENLRDVPIAVNVVGGEALKNIGVADTQALIQAVPTLNFTRSGPSGIFIIRGVSTPNGAAGEEGSTAVYVDDVYMPDLAQTVNKFNNIQRIELLNGPQGTLFGRNAVGGLIRVITRDPGDHVEADAQAGYANYRMFSGSAYFSTPLSDRTGFNVAVTGQHQGRGFGFNPTLNTDVKTENFIGVRTKFVARPSDRVKITLTGEYFKTDHDVTLYIFPIGAATWGASQNSPAGTPSGTDIRVYGFSGKIEADLGFGTLTSITAYRNLRNKSVFDVDGGAADILNLRYVADSKSFQQELRLASATTEPLSWQIGAFYLHLVAEQDQTQAGLAFAGLPGGSPPNRIHIVAKGVTDSIALFGEVTYAITPTTHLTGGVRWTSDNRKLPIGYTDRVNSAGTVFAHFTNALSEVTYNQVTFRAALRQDLSDTANVYASVNRGFKSGQFNLQTPQDAPVRPETIMAYEIGFKGEFLDRRLRLSAAAFHYDIKDYQIRSSPQGVSVLANAASVKIDGVDVNVEAAITRRFHLTAGAAWLNARYSSFPSATTGNATGNKTALAPNFTFSTTANYTVPLNDNGSELRFTASWLHKSSYFFEPDNVLRQPAYDVVNASVEYRLNENIGIEFWMKNIGDELYNVQMVTAVGRAALAGPPRQYGFNLKVNY